MMPAADIDQRRVKRICCSSTVNDCNAIIKDEDIEANEDDLVRCLNSEDLSLNAIKRGKLDFVSECLAKG